MLASVAFSLWGILCFATSSPWLKTPWRAVPYVEGALPLLCLSDTLEYFFGSKGASLTF